MGIGQLGVVVRGGSGQLCVASRRQWSAGAVASRGSDSSRNTRVRRYEKSAVLDGIRALERELEESGLSLMLCEDATKNPPHVQDLLGSLSELPCFWNQQ